MFSIAYAFKGHAHVFAGRVKVVSHSSFRTSAIFKYFCPLHKPETLFCYGLLCMVYDAPQTNIHDLNNVLFCLI